MTDFRALCARMADELDHYRQLLMDDRRATHALAAEARAALAQPEPQGPTDEELDDISDGTTWYGLPRRFGREVARAAIALDRARWGRPAIEPVSVSERLPGPEDCDAEGKCWWWYPPRAGNAPTYGYWAHEDDATDRAHHEWPAAWLPHWALPVPKREAEQ
jgi:hypothetical protein